MPDDWIIETCPFCCERADTFLRRFSGAGYRINTRHSGCAVGLEIGGYNDRPDWPKLGPPLLIAACLILAIRTAKWAARHDEKLSNHELNREIDYSIHLADSVCPGFSPERTHFPTRTRALVSGETMRTFRNDGQSKRADSLSSPRPSLSDFSKTCFGEQTTAMLFRNHSGFASKPAHPPFSRCHIRCKSFLIAFPIPLPSLGRPLSSLFSGRLLFR